MAFCLKILWMSGWLYGWLLTYGFRCYWWVHSYFRCMFLFVLPFMVTGLFFIVLFFINFDVLFSIITFYKWWDIVFVLVSVGLFIFLPWWISIILMTYLSRYCLLFLIRIKGIVQSAFLMDPVYAFFILCTFDFI